MSDDHANCRCAWGPSGRDTMMRLLRCRQWPIVCDGPALSTSEHRNWWWLRAWPQEERATRN